MKVYAFDRDSTIDVNKGHVPLDWVKKLANTLFFQEKFVVKCHPPN